MISSAKEFIIFRDDLYPSLGGGNKGRKMDYIARDIEEKKARALVTTGGVQSNHCRAVALYAAQQKLNCTLVLHGEQNAFNNQSGNAKIMRLSGAEIIFVNAPQEIGLTMDEAMENYRKQGENPYYIWGGGHTLEGGLAYIDAVKELKDFQTQNNWTPDYIFHASGTGSTQAGILAGLDKFNFNNTEVIGISVGRSTEKAEPLVGDFYKKLCTHYDIAFKNKKSTVSDQYLLGGYGGVNNELKELCRSSIKKYGFTLDTCYSGKAFYGMLDHIKSNHLEHKNILFWHTGGVFNFLAEEI